MNAAEVRNFSCDTQPHARDGPPAWSLTQAVNQSWSQGWLGSSVEASGHFSPSFGIYLLLVIL